MGKKKADTSTGGLDLSPKTGRNLAGLYSAIHERTPTSTQTPSGRPTATDSRSYAFAKDEDAYSSSVLSQLVQNQTRTAGFGLERLAFARYRQANLTIAKPQVAPIAKLLDMDYPNDDSDPQLSFVQQVGTA